MRSTSSCLGQKGPSCPWEKMSKGPKTDGKTMEKRGLELKNDGETGENIGKMMGK